MTGYLVNGSDQIEALTGNAQTGLTGTSFIAIPPANTTLYGVEDVLDPSGQILYVGAEDSTLSTFAIEAVPVPGGTPSPVFNDTMFGFVNNGLATTTITDGVTATATPYLIYGDTDQATQGFITVSPIIDASGTLATDQNTNTGPFQAMATAAISNSNTTVYLAEGANIQPVTLGVQSGTVSFDNTADAVSTGSGNPVIAMAVANFNGTQVLYAVSAGPTTGTALDPTPVPGDIEVDAWAIDATGLMTGTPETPGSLVGLTTQQGTILPGTTTGSSASPASIAIDSNPNPSFVIVGVTGGNAQLYLLPVSSTGDFTAATQSSATGVSTPNGGLNAPDPISITVLNP
jgi:hypothetical protein